MGKWSHLKNVMTEVDGKQVRKYPQPPDEAKDFEARVAHVQRAFADRPIEDLADALRELKAEKVALEEQVSEIGLQQEAVSRVVVARFEAQGIASTKLADGGSLGLEDTPQFKLVDPAAFRRWIDETQPDVLTVYAQTRDGIAKARLEAGEPLPPGVELAHVRTTARLRQR